jgi:hypothetical protein
MPFDFRWNADGNSVQKCGISNQPDICIRDDPCLSKFGALLGACPHPRRQFVGLLSLVCRTCTRWIVQTRKRHGIRCKYPSGRNAFIFSQRIFHLYFHLKSRGMILLSYYLSLHYASRQMGLPVSCGSPHFLLFYFSCIQTRIWFKPRLPHAK